MKKTVFMLALVFLAGMSFAQMKKDRTSAYNYWQKGELAKAKEYIDKAMEYPEAATDAKVWVYKANIYLELNVKPEFQVLAKDALLISYEAFLKAKELDTKNEFQILILPRMQVLEGQFFYEGRKFFEAEKTDEAISCFEKAVKIGKDYNIIDTISIYATALCYEKKGDKAKAISTYNQLVELKMNEPRIYYSLSMLYKDEGDIEQATKVLEKGLAQYPDDKDLIIAQANIYISTKKHDKALQSLFIARDKEPGNVSIHYAIGVTYDLLKNDSTLSQADRDKYFEEAVKAYSETIKMDSNFFDALFNLGAVFYNRGGDIINIANKLPLSETKKYDELMADGNINLKKALPYLESASRLQPNDKNTLVSLKEIYTRLNMMEKLNAINERLK